MAFETHRPGGFPQTDVPPVGAEAISYGGGNQTLSPYARGVYISSAGDLKVDMASGDTVTFTGLAAGQMYPMVISKLYQTGSTAAGLVLR